LKVDAKGRILIPNEIRSLLNIENVVSAHADDMKLWSRTSKPLFNNAITSIFFLSTFIFNFSLAAIDSSLDPSYMSYRLISYSSDKNFLFSTLIFNLNNNYASRHYNNFIKRIFLTRVLMSILREFLSNAL
jgi:hypothetical protein